MMQRRDFLKSLGLALAAFLPWGKAPIKTAPIQSLPPLRPFWPIATDGITIPAGTYVISQELIEDDIAWSAVWRRVAETDAWNQSAAGDSWADDCGEFGEEL